MGVAWVLNCMSNSLSLCGYHNIIRPVGSSFEPVRPLDVVRGVDNGCGRVHLLFVDRKLVS